MMTFFELLCYINTLSSLLVSFLLIKTKIANNEKITTFLTKIKNKTKNNGNRNDKLESD